MPAKVAAIICAAGPANRFGGKRKKQFVDVAGRACFLRSVELFSNREDVKQILLAIPQEDEEIVKIRYGANLSLFNVKLLIGGTTRFETVNKALRYSKTISTLLPFTMPPAAALPPNGSMTSLRPPKYPTPQSWPAPSRQLSRKLRTASS